MQHQPAAVPQCRAAGFLSQQRQAGLAALGVAFALAVGARGPARLPAPRPLHRAGRGLVSDGRTPDTHNDTQAV